MLGQTNELAFQTTQTPGSQYFFIIQKGIQYGLGDKDTWYANTPKGDTIFHVGDEYFAVRNSGYYTLYDESLKPLRGSLSRVKDFGKCILLGDSVGYQIYSKEKKRATYYLDSIAEKESFIMLYKNNKQGIYYKYQKFDDLILPLYDKVGPYYDGTLLIDNGKMGWSGIVSIPIEFEHIYKEQNKIMVAQNNRGKVYYSFLSQLKLLIEPSDSVVFYDHYYKRVRKDVESIFLIKDNSLLEESKEYQLHPFSFQEFFVEPMYTIAVKDSQCAVVKNGKLLTEFNYDNFLTSGVSNSYFKVVKNGKLGVINDKGEEQLKLIYTDIESQIGQYYIVRQGSKRGILKQGDSIVLRINYTSVHFQNQQYAFMSEDGRLFGVVDYVAKKTILPCKYKYIEIQDSIILATLEGYTDVYCKGELKQSGLRDAVSNGSTVKGYKNGKILIGYLRNSVWEEYSYDIPTYRVSNKNDDKFTFGNTVFSDVQTIYDYSVGKWGRFSFMRQQWVNKPLAHGGYKPSGERLLDFRQDSLITWNGIQFYSGKAISPIQIAWDLHSKYHWLDENYYAYSEDNVDSEHQSVSPILYETPGKGECLYGYTSTKVNTIYKLNANKAILVENGKIEISSSGDVSLSEFITKLSTSGNIHPAALNDYEKIINPNLYISIKGANEHVLHNAGVKQKHISIRSSFEWLNKKSSTPLIFRKGNFQGVVSDSGDVTLMPEFLSIEHLENSNRRLLKVGLKGKNYKVYDPAKKVFSNDIWNLVEVKDQLLLIQLDSTQQAVLNERLDTLLITQQPVKLLGETDFFIQKNNEITLYRAEKILFGCEGESIEKINGTHFLLRTNKAFNVLGLNGRELFSSPHAIKHLDLGENYLLDDGHKRSIFNGKDERIYSFQKSRYVLNENQDLIIKEDNTTRVIRKSAETTVKMKGKFLKASKKFIVVKHGKYKSVYNYAGEVIVPKTKSVKLLEGNFLTYKQGITIYLLNGITKEKRKVKKMTERLEEEESDYEDEVVYAQNKVTQRDTVHIKQVNGLYRLQSKNGTVFSPNYFFIKKIATRYLVLDEVAYKVFDNYNGTFVSEESYQAIEPYKDYFMVVKNGVINYMAFN
jgi:hypothetical protein